jgi:hypothetical protein
MSYNWKNIQKRLKAYEQALAAAHAEGNGERMFFVHQLMADLGKQIVEVSTEISDQLKKNTVHSLGLEIAE